jgi:hypothetical protein
MANEQGMNLTRAAYLGRQTIKFGAIFLVSLIIGRFVVTAAWNYWVATHPPAPPPPTVGFGILPDINFPAQTSADKPASYILEIPPSRLPRFGDRAKVFLMLRSSIGLFTDQKAREMAANYGFVFAPSKLSEKEYRWTKTQPIQATLDMNIENFTFDLTTDYLSRVELLSQRNIPDEEAAITVVRSFVIAGQPLPPDLATAAGEIKYLRSEGGELSEAVALSDADFAQVDIRRLPIDGNKAFYSPEGYQGAIHAVLTGALTGQNQIVEMSYHYQEVDYAERHTYPIRSIDSAWQIVQAGEAYVADKGTFENAIIRDIKIGYYDDFSEQDYMQPIYVFEGDGGFLAYVPAIDPQYYQSAQATDSTTTQ